MNSLLYSILHGNVSGEMTGSTRLFCMIIQVFNHPFNEGLHCKNHLQFEHELQGWLLSQLFHLKF